MASCRLASPIDLSPTPPLKGRGQTTTAGAAGSGRVKVLQNRLQDTCCLNQNFLVAESENAPAPRNEVCGALVIGCKLVLMVAAVYLDRDSVFIADEVCYERADRLLAFEVQSREPICSEMIPEAAFGGG